MTETRRSFLELAGSAAAIFAAPSLAYAENYPAHPVRVIVPFAPGGIDVVIRLLAPELTNQFGQRLVIENVAGGGSSIGTVQAARAVPDGHTLLFTASAFVIFPALHEKIGYRPLEDFAPITAVASSSMVLLVHPSVEAGSVKELATLIKSHPGQYSFASAGVGTPPHLTGELFRQSLGLDLVHVPYHSGGEAVASVISNSTPLCFAAVAPAVAQVKAGKLRALAVAGAQRVAAIPTVPTMAEAGYPSVEGEVWCGMLAPAKTPSSVVMQLHGAITKILAQQAFRKRLETDRYYPGSIRPSNLYRTQKMG